MEQLKVPKDDVATPHGKYIDNWALHPYLIVEYLIGIHLLL